jgi:VacB/RNase II family 3'-5' exoribonuclease
MKVNSHQQVPNYTAAGGVKDKRTEQPDGVREQRDQVEVNGSRPNGETKGVHGKREHKDKYAHKKQLKDSNAFVGINAAGQGGLAAGIAAANLHYPDGRWDLKAIADKALTDHGLATEYPPAVLKQVEDIQAPAVGKDPWVRDYRHLPFSSIDNATSRDLDQLEYAEKLPNGDIKVFVAVTDVDSLVPKDSPLDKHAMNQTTSVYTPDKVYNLLPEKLSCDFISLNPNQDRLSFVVEYTVAPDGSLKEESVYQAMVNSQAKLDYPSIGGWLDGETEMPDQLGQAGPKIIEQIEIQHEAAQRLKHKREQDGALVFASNETKIKVENGTAVDVEPVAKNSATELVENFMVTSNGVVSRFLDAHGMPSIERVVVQPEKWDKIVDVAAQHGTQLPEQVDGDALSAFLATMQNQDPEGFPELSSQVIRLIGRGEFVAHMPGEPLPGHFSLGVTNYAQFTAEMRRAGDIVNGRNVKAALAGKPSPYTAEEMRAIALNLTEKEQAAKKAERQAEKAAVATMLENRIGDTFEAVVSGKNQKGVWVRISNPPAEGFLDGGNGLKQGKKLTVRLESVNVEKGHINFSRA